MDWQAERIIYPSGKQTLAKPRSDSNIFINNVCPAVHCECKESLDYSLMLKRLKLDCEVDMSSKKLPSTPRDVRDVETCICTECLDQENKIIGFRTREISSLRLVIQGHQILNHQGIKHSPEDVAPYWKKDSRMWLWKSVRLTRKRRNKSKSLTRLPSIV